MSRLGQFIDNDFILRDSDFWFPIILVTISTILLSVNFNFSEQASWLLPLFKSITLIGMMAFVVLTIAHIGVVFALAIKSKPKKHYEYLLPDNDLNIMLVPTINKSRVVFNSIVVLNILLLYYSGNGNFGMFILVLFVLVLTAHKIIKNKVDFLIKERLRS